MNPGRADVTSELLAVFYHGGKEKTMFKAINKLICIMLLIFGIGAAADGNFITAGIFAAWPFFVLIVSLAYNPKSSIKSPSRVFEHEN